jgi:PmbA protein
MLRDTERQITSLPLGDAFVGQVVLSPQASGDLLAWLIREISDARLVGGSSLYEKSVGAVVASPLLSVRSRFDAPGFAPVSSDGFVAPPVDVLCRGILMTLLPSQYGSRKTGLPHVPTGVGGWEMAAGDTPRGDVLSGVRRGALVSRLSMGRPAPSGDFAGVIKNGFAVLEGEVGAAVSGTMIVGNMGRMLRDVESVSEERIDTGSTLLPWLRIADVHFS